MTPKEYLIKSLKQSVRLLCITIMLVSTAQAQEFGKVAYGANHNFGVSIGVGASQISETIDWSHMHGLGNKKNQRFKVGYGLRFTAYSGANQKYTTAPAILTSKQEGPQVLFSETHEENIDTISFANVQANALNVVIHLQYAITPKLELGFNIDAVGFSFGGQRTGTFTSSEVYQNPNVNQKAKPTSFNALLVSDNDIGTLNSEIFVRYWLNKKWAIKAGGMFLFTEYTRENKLTFDNDRFRNKSLLFMVGTSFKPFNK